mgnify:CR=1 FL=1
MFIRETPTTIETCFQETYASESRTNDAILHDLQALIDDFSLSGETIGDFEIADWTN